MSLMSLMKEKPSTCPSSVLFTVFAIVFDLAGAALIFFGLFILMETLEWTGGEEKDKG